jgi:uncharacterized coiled-coil DUF342 family protein
MKNLNTIDGLKDRLERLNVILNKTQIGSDRFKAIQAEIENTKNRLNDIHPKIVKVVTEFEKLKRSLDKAKAVNTLDGMNDRLN